MLCNVFCVVLQHHVPMCKVYKVCNIYNDILVCNISNVVGV
jgi:hypothetical protein